VKQNFALLKSTACQQGKPASKQNIHHMQGAEREKVMSTELKMSESMYNNNKNNNNYYNQFHILYTCKITTSTG